ncbi:hypothetical protein [Polyangium jinanense]|uniref:PDZ domain-containing protein n=1 Tax=Polyangium jinanense TaxID=2829994 RepID=A0A9X4AVZ4_9BACT|nr:hypothetical protein [Polyangium jinanense]MDC3956722.1 hypothetical protein [Polyangium jinanense]MDC3984785.1 hypothetical protein [Polyangium jinanense]
MSSEPYRTPSCPTCAGPHVEQAHICALCEEPFVPSGAGAEACDPCLRKACRVVARASAEKPAPRRATAVLRWLPVALAVLSVGILSFNTLVVVETSQHLAMLGSFLAEQHRAKSRGKPKTHAPPKQTAALPAPPPPREETSFDDTNVPALPSVLAALRPEVHDPDALVARVQKLREAGLDIFLVRTNLGKNVFDGGNDLRTRISPVQQGGKTVGVRYSRLGPDAIESLAGVQPGDVLVSINGFGIDNPDRALSGYASSREKGGAVFELFRNGRRVVLDVRWPK